jgi:uncharacterized membrane protein
VPFLFFSAILYKYAIIISIYINKGAFYGVRTFILFIVGMIIFPNFFGVNGVWMVVPFAEIVTLLISLIYIYKYRKEYMYDNMFAKKELEAA